MTGNISFGRSVAQRLAEEFAHSHDEILLFNLAQPWGQARCCLVKEKRPDYCGAQVRRSFDPPGSG